MRKWTLNLLFILLTYILDAQHQPSHHIHTVGSASCNHPKAATWSLAALCAGHWDILGLNGKRFYCREKPWMIPGGHYIDDMYEYIYIYTNTYSIYIYIFVEESNKQQLYGKTWRDVL